MGRRLFSLPHGVLAKPHKPFNFVLQKLSSLSHFILTIFFFVLGAWCHRQRWSSMWRPSGLAQLSCSRWTFCSRDGSTGSKYILYMSAHRCVSGLCSSLGYAVCSCHAKNTRAALALWDVFWSSLLLRSHYDPSLSACTGKRQPWALGVGEQSSHGFSLFWLLERLFASEAAWA